MHRTRCHFWSVQFFSISPLSIGLMWVSRSATGSSASVSNVAKATLQVLLCQCRQSDLSKNSTLNFWHNLPVMLDISTITWFCSVWSEDARGWLKHIDSGGDHRWTGGGGGLRTVRWHLNSYQQGHQHKIKSGTTVAQGVAPDRGWHMIEREELHSWGVDLLWRGGSRLTRRHLDKGGTLGHRKCGATSLIGLIGVDAHAYRYTLVGRYLTI